MKNTADSQFEPIKTFDPDGIPGAELDVQASGAASGNLQPGSALTASENVLDVRESHRRRTVRVIVRFHFNHIAL